MRYQKANLEECDPKLLQALKESIENGKGLFIYGETGTGKTHFCHAIVNGYKASSIYVENFVSLLGEYREYMQKGYYNDKLRELCAQEHLIIDDIGAEKVSDFVIEFLYSVVNKRYESMKRTVITTNLNYKDFGDRYGDRILSRIAEMCVLVELTGDDKRLN